MWPSRPLTYCMVQSPSWEANWSAVSQEMPLISLNPKVHYRTHKRPPPVPILDQPNPSRIPTSHLLEIRPNIHPSTPRSPQWSPSLRFPHQDPIQPPLTHTRHMPSPSHFSRFYHPHNIGWQAKPMRISSVCVIWHDLATISTTNGVRVAKIFVDTILYPYCWGVEITKLFRVPAANVHHPVHKKEYGAMTIDKRKPSTRIKKKSVLILICSP